MGGESDDSLSHFFEEPEFGDPNHLAGAASTDELFSILDTLDSSPGFDVLTPLHEATALTNHEIGAQKAFKTETDEAEASYARKKQKLSSELSMEEAVTNNPDGQQRIFHITVERNRRKQMNEHLYVLRSLVPAFHLKRGDQASIIGGVVDYITELQQILQSLEAKKQRKVYNEVLSPRQLIPLPLSPRLNLPISPRTPEPGSNYLPKIQQVYLPNTSMATTTPEASASASASTFSSSHDNVNELAANLKSTIAEVDVKVSGPNVVLKTISARIPGQAVKIVAALEELALEILHVNISTTDDTMLNSFTIKIGIECELSAEELANEIQQTFSF